LKPPEWYTKIPGQDTQNPTISDLKKYFETHQNGLAQPSQKYPFIA
jgi:hypothetical protein